MAAEAGVFCDVTVQLVTSFQTQRGLHVSGSCDESTWLALIEAGWELGDRLLMLNAPMLRGDDVADLQRSLNHVGFDCGRPDGIFGPARWPCRARLPTQLGPHRRRHLWRSDRADAAPREREERFRPGRGIHSRVRSTQRPVVDRGAPARGRPVRRSQLDHPHRCSVLTRTRRDRDVDRRVRSTGTSGRSEPVRCERLRRLRRASRRSVDHLLLRGAVVRVHRRSRRSPHTSSTNSTAVLDCRPELAGMRLPVLRETRMPAVLCSVGPVRSVVDRTNRLSEAVTRAVAAWSQAPMNATGAMVRPSVD